MTAPVIPIRPDPVECINEIRLYQDAIRQIEREISQDEAILDDTKERYKEASNALRVAIHRLHEALSI